MVPLKPLTVYGVETRDLSLFEHIKTHLNSSKTVCCIKSEFKQLISYFRDSKENQLFYVNSVSKHWKVNLKYWLKYLTAWKQTVSQLKGFRRLIGIFPTFLFSQPFIGYRCESLFGSLLAIMLTIPLILLLRAEKYRFWHESIL